MKNYFKEFANEIKKFLAFNKEMNIKRATVTELLAYRGMPREMASEPITTTVVIDRETLEPVDVQEKINNQRKTDVVRSLLEETQEIKSRYGLDEYGLDKTETRQISNSISPISLLHEVRHRQHHEKQPNSPNGSTYQQETKKPPTKKPPTAPCM